MNSVAPYLKALTAALIAALGVLALALEDNAVTAGEWVNIAIAGLTALGAVWAVPNRDPHALHQADSVQPPERGAIDAGTAILIAILLLVLLALLGAFR